MQPADSCLAVVVIVVVVISAVGVVSKTVVEMAIDISTVDNVVLDHCSTPEEIEAEVTIEEICDDGLQRPAYTLDVATTVNKYFKL